MKMILLWGLFYIIIFVNKEHNLCKSIYLLNCPVFIMDNFKQNLENLHFYYKHKMFAKLNFVQNTVNTGEWET